MRNRWRLAVSALVVAALLGLTPWLWKALDSWAGEVRSGLWQRVETVLGAPIEYQSLGPAFLSLLEFRNVRVLDSSGSNLLTASSVRIAVNWKALFMGHFSQALDKIQIINADISMELPRDQHLLDHWRALVSSSPRGGGASLRLQLEIFNLKGTWRDENQTLTLSRAFVLAGPDQSGWKVQFRGSTEWINRNSVADKAAASLSGELRADEAFTNFSSRMDVRGFQSSWFDLEPMAILAQWNPDGLTLTKAADRVPLDVQFRWTNASKSWQISGAAENLRPDRWVHLKREKNFARLAVGRFTGTFGASSDSAWRYSGKAVWPAGVFPKAVTKGPLGISGNLDGDSESVLLKNVVLAADAGRIAFSGTLDFRTMLPDGTLDVPSWTLPNGGAVRGRVVFDRLGPTVHVTALDWDWNGLGLWGIDGHLSHLGSQWTADFSGAWDAQGTRTFELRGKTDGSWTNAELQADWKGLSLAWVERVARVSTGSTTELPLANYVSDGHLEVSWNRGNLSAIISPLWIRDETRPGRQLLAHGAWTDQTISWNVDDFSWDSVHLSGGGTVTFGAVGDVVASADVQGWDHRIHIDSHWDAVNQILSIDADQGLQGRLWLTPGGGFSFRIVQPRWQWNDAWAGAADLRGRMNGKVWSVDFDQIELWGLVPGWEQPFHTRVSGTWDPDELRLDLAQWDDDGRSLIGRGQTTWSWDFSYPWVGQISLEGTGKVPEKLVANWSVVDRDDLSFGLHVVDADLGRLRDSRLTGQVSVDGIAHLSQGQWTWSGKFLTRNGRWGDDPLGVRGSAEGDLSSFRLRDLTLTTSGLSFSKGNLQWSVSHGWSGGGDLALRFGTRRWTSSWTVDAKGASGARDNPFLLSGRVVNNQISGTTIPDWDFHGQWSPEHWNFDALSGALSASGSEDGAFQASVRGPLPVRAELSGTWNGTEVDCDVRGFESEISWIKDLFPSPLFRLEAGRVVGMFRVSGTLNDPELNGILQVSELKATSSFLQTPIGPTTVPIRLEGHRVLVDTVNVGTAERPWLVSGAARLDHFVPDDYQLNIQADPLSPLPVVYRYTGISAKGQVYGVLSLRGTPYSIQLGGRLVLEDVEMTLGTSESDNSGQKLGFSSDLTLITGRNVQFLWPNESLPVLRAVAAPNQSLTIKADDVASTWSLEGKIALRTGQINYVNRTFVIKEGALTFQEDESHFDPRIALRAEWRYRSDSDTTIVSLLADGTLQNFHPRFESDPYKSPEELQQLVGVTLGIPDEYTKSGTSSSALSIASDVGTGFLMGPFEELVKKNFGLDLFTVRTDLLKNALLAGNTPLSASDYLDNTRLFFGKYVGEDLYVQGTLAFRHKDGANSTAMSIDPEFQMEFQTPLFLLNWTLLPEHPENLFVTDNSVTFKWNWSY